MIVPLQPFTAVAGQETVMGTAPAELTTIVAGTRRPADSAASGLPRSVVGVPAPPSGPEEPFPVVEPLSGGGAAAVVTVWSAPVTVPPALMATTR